MADEREDMDTAADEEEPPEEADEGDVEGEKVGAARGRDKAASGCLPCCCTRDLVSALEHALVSIALASSLLSFLAVTFSLFFFSLLTGQPHEKLLCVFQDAWCAELRLPTWC